ncbi:MAG TPA: Ig-like domain-containing protein, partial [Chitinispirillaceae bacterium]|nr:Ig-like domain-containing protein [Chitinispirillaceae bacterium]
IGGSFFQEIGKLNGQQLPPIIHTLPALPFRISKESVNEYRHDIYIEIPVIYLFSYPKITCNFKKGITTIYFEPLEFDYSVSYFPDTSKINEVIYQTFISSVTPSNNAQLVPVSTDVKLRFRKTMEHTSVENALVIRPESKYEVNWQGMDDGGELLTVQFSDLLKKGTTYSVIVDSSAKTADSVKLPRAVSSKFTTDRMRLVSCSPNTKEMYVSDSKVLTYTFSYPVDSTSFMQALSIFPAADSLQILLFDNKKTVMVLHKDFILDTTYTVVIDTTLIAYTGEHLSPAIRQTFFTGLNDSIHSTTCIQKTYPSDSLSAIECDDDIIVTFTGAMDRKSVISRITITPQVPVDFTWLSISTLQIKQLQQLQSNTNYTVTLDTGYLTLDHQNYGAGYVFKFQTKPLRAVSYYPLSGQVNVSCKQDVMIAFSTPVDTVSLLSYCYFNPPVDSIVCKRDKEGRYYLQHALFKSDTDYECILNDSVSDKYGIPAGKSFTIKFKTGKLAE